MSFFRDRIASFGYAFLGIYNLWKETHSKIHLSATVLVVLAGLYFKIYKIDWLFLIVAIAIVWIAEAFNTAIEHLTDLASPEIHPKAKITKDTAAGAVLISALFAVIIGILVFCPYFF